MDSRAVQPGDAFVAIAGFGAHGLRFVDAGERAPARARSCSSRRRRTDVPAPADAIAVPGSARAPGRDWPTASTARRRDAMTMVGVTGTNGKTSTVQLLAQALDAARHARGTHRHARRRPVRRTWCRPGSPRRCVLQVHALLAQLRDAGAQARGDGSQSRTRSTRAASTACISTSRVFTNLTRDHLDYHGDMASYGAAKARLFAWPGLQAAVINLDDAYGRALFDAVAADRAPRRH